MADRPHEGGGDTKLERQAYQRGWEEIWGRRYDTEDEDKRESEATARANAFVSNHANRKP